MDDDVERLLVATMRDRWTRDAASPRRGAESAAADRLRSGACR